MNNSKDMNSKRASGLFLVIVLIQILVVVLLIFLGPPAFLQSISGNLLLSQLMLFGPALLFLLFTKTNPISLCRFRKVHVSTMLMTVLFTFLCMPLTSLMNAISMVFVENEVANISGSVVAMPFGIAFLLMAVYGPISEEFVFRGVIYQGLKKQGNVFVSMLISALFFALMHLNFNQAAYAIALGIMLVLLMEAADSIWPVILVHLLFNGSSVCLLYLLDSLPVELMEMTAQIEQAPMEMQSVIVMYLLLATVCTPLAVCVLIWIAKREERLEHLKYVWRSRKEKKKGYLSISLVVSVVICLSFMVLMELL